MSYPRFPPAASPARNQVKAGGRALPIEKKYNLYKQMSSSMKARLLFWSGIAGWRFLSLFLQWARNLSRAPRLRGAQRSPGRPPGGAGPEVRRQSSRRLPPIWRRCEGYSCGAAHSTRGPRNPPEKRVGTFLEAHRCQCWKQPQIRLPPEQGRCRQLCEGPGWYLASLTIKIF